MKLTSKTAAALTLPAGKSEVIVFDDDIPGFGVRLRAGGERAGFSSIVPAPSSGA